MLEIDPFSSPNFTQRYEFQSKILWGVFITKQLEYINYLHV